MPGRCPIKDLENFNLRKLEDLFNQIWFRHKHMPTYALADSAQQTWGLASDLGGVSISASDHSAMDK